jgi:hypothetical protein
VDYTAPVLTPLAAVVDDGEQAPAPATSDVEVPQQAFDPSSVLYVH